VTKDEDYHYAALFQYSTGNSVEAILDFVEAIFNFVAKNGNNVQGVYHKILSFRHS